MKLIDIAHSKGANGCEIAYNALYHLYRDEKGRLILRLDERVNTDPKIVELFSELKSSMEEITHPRILQPLAYTPDEEGGFWTMDDEDVMSLGEYLKATPSALANEEWKEQYISQLTDCLDFMHKRNALEVELNLHSLMVTNNTGHNVRLLPPCHTFLTEKDYIWIKTPDYLAPEVAKKQELTSKADIYGLGYIIKALYPLGDIPYKYRQTTTIATESNLDKRFSTTGELRRFSEESQKKGLVKGALTTAAIVVSISGIVIWGLTREDNVPAPRPLTEQQADSIDEVEKLKAEVDAFLDDTTYMQADTAASLSEHAKMAQKKNMEKAIRVYELELRKQAEPLVRKIYSDEMMSQDLSSYKAAVEKASQDLQKIQTRLAKQYQIEPSTANHVGNRVIQELADQFLKKK